MRTHTRSEFDGEPLGWEEAAVHQRLERTWLLMDWQREVANSAPVAIDPIEPFVTEVGQPSIPTDEIDETLAFLDASFAILEGDEGEAEYMRTYGVQPEVVVCRDRSGLVEGYDDLSYKVNMLLMSDNPGHQTMAKMILKQLGEWPLALTDGK